MKMTVLFVERDRLLVKSAVRYLERLQPEWKILIAYSAAEGKRLFALNEADALVLGLELPDRDGLELLSEFKFSNPKLPVLVVSDHDNEGLRDEAAVRGASGFFSKPFPPLALAQGLGSAVAEIREILQGWDGAPKDRGEEWEITVPARQPALP